MHCDKCNAQVSAEDRFCGKCFNTLNRDKSFILDMGSVLRENTSLIMEPNITEEADLEGEGTIEKPQISEEPLVKNEGTTQEPQILEEPVITNEVTSKEPQILEEPVVKNERATRQPQTLKEPVVKNETTTQVSQVGGEISQKIKKYVETLEDEIGLRKINRRIFVTHPALLNYRHFVIAITILLISLIELIRTPSLIFFSITVVPSGIFLFALICIKASFTDKGYVDLHRVQDKRSEKTRYFKNGRKELHAHYPRKGLVITDLTDPSVVNEIKSWK